MKKVFPLISVIVPFWNTARHARQCIQSLLEQSFADIEFIFVNDGSPDECLDIIRSYEKQDSRVIVIDKKNGGQASARNAGLAIARAEFIAFVDSDDWVEKNMYQQLYTAAQKAPFFPDGVFGGYQQDFTGKNRFHPISLRTEYLTDSSELYTKLHLSTIWLGLYRKDFLMEHNIYFDESLRSGGEDELFSFKFYSSAPQVITTPQCPYHYRMWENSETHRFIENRFDTARIFAEKAHLLLQKNPHCDSTIKNELARRICSCFFSALMNEHNHDSPYQPSERRERLKMMVQSFDFRAAMKNAQENGLLGRKRALALYFIQKHLYRTLDVLCKLGNYAKWRI